MKSIFLSISILICTCVSLFSADLLFADDNITSSKFTISLQKMDPVGENHAYDPSEYSAQGAAAFLLDMVASVLLFVLPLIAGVSFIIAGYYYVLSGGDSEKASKAKTIIKWNLIAIVIALFSYVLIYIVSSLLTGSL